MNQPSKQDLPIAVDVATAIVRRACQPHAVTWVALAPNATYLVCARCERQQRVQVTLQREDWVRNVTAFVTAHTACLTHQ